MSSLFSIPDIDINRTEINLYQTPVPSIDDDTVIGFADRFGIHGAVVERGSRRVVKDRSGVLEVFEASGSLWWTKKSNRRSEPRRSIIFPDDDEAIVRADRCLDTVGLGDRHARPVSVSYTTVVHEREGGAKWSEATIGQHVNYGFILDDLNVWGPGAKIQVSFGEGQEVTEALKFWRTPAKDTRELKVLPAKEAVRRFQNDETFGELDDKDAHVKVRQVRLGYYAIPPREVQPYLIPVYRFDASAKTDHIPDYDFAHYILAADLQLSFLKGFGAVTTSEPVAIS